jgi:thioredoxin-dependent peroxiredoxin
MKAIIAATILLSALSTGMAQNLPQAGAIAPAVNLPSNDGRQVSLNDYKGKWVVLYFYPKDFTKGCTLEAQNFQRDLAKYQNDSAVILGVSVDNAESHKNFCAKEGLNFKLLADTDAKVSQAYGSLENDHGKKWAARNTFIINPEGKIARVFTKVNPQTHSEEVLQALTDLKKS